MASTTPQPPPVVTASTILSLLGKLGDVDPDFRFMSLNDLLQLLTAAKPDFFDNNAAVAVRCIDGIIKALDDANGEVQNLAIKCLTPLSLKASPFMVAPLLEKLCNLELKNSVDTAIPALALRTVVTSLPPPPPPGTRLSHRDPERAEAITRVLLPRLLGPSAVLPVKSSLPGGGSGKNNAPAPAGLLQHPKTANPDFVDVLIEVIRVFGRLIDDRQIVCMQQTISRIIDHDYGVTAVKRRAVVAVSVLAPYLSDEILARVVGDMGRALSPASASATPAGSSTRRNYITIAGSMARSIPTRFGQHLPALAPSLLAVLGEDELVLLREQLSDGGGNVTEFNEVREAALVTLEAFLSACPREMEQYGEETLTACLRYIKYDPNMAPDGDGNGDGQHGRDGDGMDMDPVDDRDGGEDGDEDDEFGDDAEFDDEDDDDDGSWKVRRSAAKALYTLIATTAGHDGDGGGALFLDGGRGSLYGRIAPALISRFGEREENVRLDILALFSFLVRKSGEGLSPLDRSPDDLELLAPSDPAAQLSSPVASRKRRRQSSGNDSFLVTAPAPPPPQASLESLSPVLEKMPESGPRADLARLTPTLVRHAIGLLRGKMVATKQSIVNLLDDLVCVQRGSTAEALDGVIPYVIDTIIKPVGSAGPVALSALAGGGGGGGGGEVGTGGGSGGVSTAAATPITLKIAALRFIGHVARIHPIGLLQPHLGRMMEATIGAAADRFYKVSSEAIRTAEELVRAITPPRIRTGGQRFKPELSQLYEMILYRSSASDADLEVRQRAIHALALLVARASSHPDSSWFPPENRSQALGTLVDRLRSETTRLAAVRAIELVMASSSPAALQLPDGEAWARDVALELAAQLRKSDRTLRVSSVQVLGRIVASWQLDGPTLAAVVAALLPGVASGDALLLGPSLLILATLATRSPDTVTTADFSRAVCELLRSSLAGIVLDQMLALADAVGRSGRGSHLMGMLLQSVSLAGDPAVVGKTIGTLLAASGGNSGGVTINSFVTELKTSAKAGDDGRASLALAVLGEVGVRLGDQSGLGPDLFLDHFRTEPDKVSLAAAAALGRVAAGNVDAILPIILDRMAAIGPSARSDQSGRPSSGANMQYLLILAVKEVLLLQQVVSAEPSSPSRLTTRQYVSALWDRLLEACASLDNKVVCAECVGRLVTLDPTVFMPKLQILLKDQSTEIRGMAVQAVRYSLTETDEAFYAVLEKELVHLLLIILRDEDLDIRRLAMSTLNSAAHNKPGLVLPHIPQLMPFVVSETVKNEALIREVRLGPFTHVVDDGLELRKSAYDTLYALMEAAFARISVEEFCDRVVAGLEDDNDIRSLCNLMLAKLIVLRPDEMVARIEKIARCYQSILSTKLKDNSVRQDVEKQEEANKGALRLTLLIQDRLEGMGWGDSRPQQSSPGGEGGQAAIVGAGHPAWSAYWLWVKTNRSQDLMTVQTESRELQMTM